MTQSQRKRKIKPPAPVQVPEHTGKDEMNLAELPFASLRNRGDKRKAIIYEGWATDEEGNRYKQEWIAQGGSLVGLPNEFDERVLVALLAVTARYKFRTRKVPFSVYQLVKIMGLTRSRQTYEYIENSLDRLLAVSFKTKQAFWDNDDKKRITNVRGFHLIEEYWLRYREADETVKDQEGVPGFIVWSDEIWKSFRSGYIKNLDLDFFYRLQTPLARRLYRFLDKRMQYQQQYEIDIFDLAGRLGMSRYKYPSKVLSKLQPALDELIAEGYLKDSEMIKVGKYTRMRFRQNSEDAGVEVATMTPGTPLLSLDPEQSALPNHVTRETAGNTEMDVIALLIEMGLSSEIAQQLASLYASEQIFEKLAYLSFWQQTAPGKIKNPHGWLRRAIEEDYEAPTGYETKVARTQEQADIQRSFWDEMSMDPIRPYPKTWKERLIEDQQIPQEWVHLTLRLQDEMALLTTRATYDAWMAQLLITGLDDGAAVIAVPTKAAWEWLNHSFKVSLERMLSYLLEGQGVSVKFVVVE